MDNAIYASLSRQTGLLREMTGIANNLANMSTTGFRRQGAVFAEYVRDLGPGEASLSMASALGRRTDLGQGALTRTGSSLDLAIEGEGFFQVATPAGNRLTRAGGFSTDAAGTVVTPDGNPLLDTGGAPVVVPPGTADIGIGRDGTLSADGVPVGQIGLWLPGDPQAMARQDGVLFEDAAGPVPAGPETFVVQGFVEDSNVSPVTEIARMIEVQRAYELGQGLLDKEDDRIRETIRTIGR